MIENKLRVYLGSHHLDTFKEGCARKLSNRTGQLYNVSRRFLPFLRLNDKRAKNCSNRSLWCCYFNYGLDLNSLDS
uniref:Uncharacterized protein n=1 Tax=Caenorhabditis japonica TaxID=281687 RepID=A0A8R1IB15_CAEJA